MRHEEYDLSRLAGLTPTEMYFQVRKDLEYAMPRVGLTKHTARIGGQIWERLTWRCPAEGCWYVCTPSSEENLKEIQEYHTNGNGPEGVCPSPPRRESLPSGHTETEKLWREMDDAIDALQAGTEYREMRGAELKAYARGLAFCLVMKEKENFPDMKAVARESVARWKMRRGLIPLRSTPTRYSGSYSSMSPAGGWSPTEKSPPRTAVRTAKPAVPKLSADKITAIRAALASGMFDHGDIATMYGVTAEQIRAVADSPAG